MGEEGKQGEQQIDYKAEFEKLKGENEKLQKKTEELSLEFMSEEYLDFLSQKDNKSKTESKTTTTKTEVKTEDDDWEKLSKKQVYEKALKDAEEKLNSKLSDFQKQQKEEADSRTASEVKKFASTHEDFETYRPIMYGLSLDPKNADLGLQELYEKSKKHVKELAGASEEEKAKSRKSQGEKPGGSSSSVKKGEKPLSADEAAEEAWGEVVGDKGLPTAI